MADLNVLLSPQEIDLFHLTPPKTKTPVWAYWKDFVEDRRFSGFSDETIRSTYDALRTIMKRTGLCTLEQINHAKHFRAILRSQSEQYHWSHQTFNDYVRKIRYYFDWLETEDYINESRLRKIAKHRTQPTEQSTFTRDQVLLISDHMHKRKPLYDSLQYFRDLLIFQVFEYTGIRNCELLDMKTDSVYRDRDDGKWKIRIQGKKQKGRARYFVAPTYLVANYRDYIALRSEPSLNSGALWVSAKEPTKPFSSYALKMLYRRISAEVGFKVSGHRYRRFVATELARKGVDIHAIKRHLGHTRLSTTELYIERSACLTSASSEAMIDILGRTSLRHASQ